MALGMFINYVDRGNLATVGPVLQDQLHISPTELGSLFSALRPSGEVLARAAPFYQDAGEAR